MRIVVAVEVIFHIPRLIIRLILCEGPILVIPYGILLLMPGNIPNTIFGRHPDGVSYIRAILAKINLVRFQDLKSPAEIRGPTPIKRILEHDVPSPDVTIFSSCGNGVKQGHGYSHNSRVVGHLMPFSFVETGIAETVAAILMDLFH